MPSSSSSDPLQNHLPAFRTAPIGGASGALRLDRIDTDVTTMFGEQTAPVFSQSHSSGTRKGIHVLRSNNWPTYGKLKAVTLSPHCLHLTASIGMAMMTQRVVLTLHFSDQIRKPRPLPRRQRFCKDPPTGGLELPPAQLERRIRNHILHFLPMLVTHSNRKESSGHVTPTPWPPLQQAGLHIEILNDEMIGELTKLSFPSHATLSLVPLRSTIWISRMVCDQGSKSNLTSLGERGLRGCKRRGFVILTLMSGLKGEVLPSPSCSSVVSRQLQRHHLFRQRHLRQRRGQQQREQLHQQREQLHQQREQLHQQPERFHRQPEPFHRQQLLLQPERFHWQPLLLQPERFHPIQPLQELSVGLPVARHVVVAPQFGGGGVSGVATARRNLALSNRGKSLLTPI